MSGSAHASAGCRSSGPTPVLPTWPLLLLRPLPAVAAVPLRPDQPLLAQLPAGGACLLQRISVPLCRLKTLVHLRENKGKVCVWMGGISDLQQRQRRAAQPGHAVAGLLSMALPLTMRCISAISDWARSMARICSAHSWSTVDMAVRLGASAHRCMKCDASRVT